VSLGFVGDVFEVMAQVDHRLTKVNTVDLLIRVDTLAENLGCHTGLSAATPATPLPRDAAASPRGRPRQHEAISVPHYYKLSFPTFNGREDPLGWLNRCEQFFRAQRTGEGDKVGLASFHMTGAAQHWYFMLERDAGVVSWPHFKALCQQRFGPAMGVNHLADLARIPFCNSVDEYI
jgi:hypothetical protein